MRPVSKKIAIDTALTQQIDALGASEFKEFCAILRALEQCIDRILETGGWMDLITVTSSNFTLSVEFQDDFSRFVLTQILEHNPPPPRPRKMKIKLQSSQRRRDPMELPSEIIFRDTGSSDEDTNSHLTTCPDIEPSHLPSLHMTAELCLPGDARESKIPRCMPLPEISAL